MVKSYKFLKVTKELLLAISRDDCLEIRDWCNELLNLVTDKEHPTEFEKETAEYLEEELTLEIAEAKYE